MSFMRNLVEQAKHPKGKLGSMMLKMMNSAHTNMYHWALNLIDSQGEPTILDIGCGGGKTIQLLSGIFPNGVIYGIDHSEQAVKESMKANQKGVQAGKITILQADVASLPFEENSFHVATAIQNHYFWPDLEKSVREVYRVLRPGGSFLIVCEKSSIDYHMKTYRTIDEMERLFERCWFRTASVFEHENKRWLCFRGRK